MPISSKFDIILVRYLFSDLSNAKVRPAVVMSPAHSSQDISRLTLRCNRQNAQLAGSAESSAAIELHRYSFLQM